MQRGGTSDKKGMSPLIATVLLMAFAVALGGMIMNISVGKNSASSGDCDLIKIKVTQFCSQGEHIMLSMRNDGDSIQLQGIKLNIVEDKIESTLSIKDSTLSPGQPLEIAIPAATTENTRVDLIGVVGNEHNPITCTDPKETANPIKPC